MGRAWGGGKGARRGYTQSRFRDTVIQHPQNQILLPFLPRHLSNRLTQSSLPLARDLVPTAIHFYSPCFCPKTCFQHHGACRHQFAGDAGKEGAGSRDHHRRVVSARAGEVVSPLVARLLL